jgi:hypothetical protein
MEALVGALHSTCCEDCVDLLRPGCNESLSDFLVCPGSILSGNCGSEVESFQDWHTAFLTGRAGQDLLCLFIFRLGDVAGSTERDYRSVSADRYPYRDGLASLPCFDSSGKMVFCLLFRRIRAALTSPSSSVVDFNTKEIPSGSGCERLVEGTGIVRLDAEPGLKVRVLDISCAAVAAGPSP